MFSRRRPSPANPRVDPSTSAAATTAATSAFGRSNSLGNPSLSSAAAAAALRSFSPTPEPVGNVQTKRMVRRGSTSSQGSTGVGVGGNGRPALRRAGSSGSMTERTFRPASPALRNGATSPSMQSAVRPSSSLASPVVRVTSPTPANGKRSSSADEASTAPPGTSRQAKRLSNVAEDDDELDRAHADFAKNFARRDETESQSSNFLQPTGSSKKYTHGAGKWFKAGSSDTWPVHRPASPQNRTYSMPTKINPPAQSKRVSSQAGLHLAKANHSAERVYGVAPGTSYTTPPRSYPAAPRNSFNTSDMVYDPNTRSFVYNTGEQARPSTSPTRSTATGTVYDPNTRTFIPKSQVTRSASAAALVEREPVSSPATTPAPIAPKKQRPVPAVPPILEPPPKNPARYARDPASPTSPVSAATLQKQPSVVREDREAEERAEGAVSASTKSIDTTPAPTVLPAKTYVARANEDHPRSASLDVPTLGFDAGARGRNASQSPQRAARFSPSPVLRPEIHVPPPRDLSPAKSAMKQSPASSVRAASPIVALSPLALPRVASPASETSETPSLTSQDGLSSKKKKAVRVSFDENAQQIPTPIIATSPALDRAPLSSDAEDDVVMPSRPALPSFGSVRRDRMQPELAEKVTEMPPARHGASSDHAIAGILRSNEPVPPEVTSKEGEGYVSDESSEADVPAASTAVAETTSTAGQTSVGASTIMDFAPASNENDGTAKVPGITLYPPTPKLLDDDRTFLSPPNGDVTQNRNSMEGIVVPGGWSRDVDDAAQGPAIDQAATKPTPEIFDGDRNLSAEDSAATMTVTPIQLTSSPLELSDIDEDSDDQAEFSDAVEDPSDLEDEGTGGFASLDAIVESPIVLPPSPTQPKTRAPEPDAPESPTPRRTVQQTTTTTDALNDSPSSPVTGNWDEATSYWSQLSKERRAQIEREHLSSDDEPPRPVVNTTKKTLRKPQDQTTRQVASGAATSRQQQPAPTMRKSMRAQPGPVAADTSGGTPHMRRSMREGGRMTSSFREAPARQRSDYSSDDSQPALQKKTLRPLSAGGRPLAQQQPSDRRSQDSSFPTLRTNKAPPPARAPAPQVSARLQKELSKADDSDSESSFRKRRKSKSSVDAQGRYFMAASMRGAAVEQPPLPSPTEKRPSSPTPAGGGRFGKLRSLSPPFSRNKSPSVSSYQESGLRNTLRSNPPAKRPQTPSKQTPTPKPRFQSRFVDSDDSDEDEAPRRAAFRSRFVDSDDEEAGPSGGLRADLTPVRGIPRKQGREDGDSTDLEDEDDEPTKATKKGGKKGFMSDPAEVERVMALARRNLGMTETSAAAVTTPPPTQQGDALQKGSLRGKPAEETPQSTANVSDINFAPPDIKKRGFMGSILRRNRNSSSSVPQVAVSSPARAPTSPAVPTSPEASKVERPTSPNPTSPTRPSLGKLRKNSGRLSRGNSYLSETAASPNQSPAAVPKLSDKVLDSWARPSSPAVDNLERPTTSDGFSPEAIKLAQSMRPDLAPRSQSHQLAAGGSGTRRVQIQAGEEGSEPGEREPRNVYSQRTGKKKKFGTLRRVFGLND